MIRNCICLVPSFDIGALPSKSWRGLLTCSTCKGIFRYPEDVDKNKEFNKIHKPDELIDLLNKEVITTRFQAIVRESLLLLLTKREASNKRKKKV